MHQAGWVDADCRLMSLRRLKRVTCVQRVSCQMCFRLSRLRCIVSDGPARFPLIKVIVPALKLCVQMKKFVGMCG